MGGFSLRMCMLVWCGCRTIAAGGSLSYRLLLELTRSLVEGGSSDKCKIKERGEGTYHQH